MSAPDHEKLARRLRAKDVPPPPRPDGELVGMSAVTLLTSASGRPINKIVERNAAGVITKRMAPNDGRYIARTVPVPDLKAMAEVLRLLGERPDCTLSLGVFRDAPDQPFAVLPEKLLAKRLGIDRHDRKALAGFHEIDGKPAAARLKANMEFGSWLVLDRDVVDGMPAELATLGRAEWLAAMDLLLPGIAQARHILLPSTSSRIAVDGTPMQSASCHLFVQASAAAEIARVYPQMLPKSFATALPSGTVLGFMRPKFSRNEPKSIVAHCPWSIFDPSVGSPERLLFDGAPVVAGAGLKVLPQQIEPFEGAPLELAAIPDLDQPAIDAAQRLTAATIRLSRSGKGKSARVTGMTTTVATLSLDLEVETQDGWTTVGELHRAGAGHTRIQAPFRESSTWNAYYSTHDDGSPFIFDNGVHIKYVLPDERTPIQLNELHFNANVRRCAEGMRDIIYMRGPIPRILARADAAGGRYIEDRDGKAVEIGGVHYRPGSLLFIDATSEIVSWHLDENFTFWKLDKRSQEQVATACPPRVAARVIGSATELGFRPCSGFVRVPLFINGNIVTTPGWHAPTGLIIDLRDDLPVIPAKPTMDQASAALEELLHPFRGYLKDNPDLRPTLAAAAMTAVLRPSIPTAPAILVDGNVIGAGKGKVARALAVLAVDGLPAIIAEGHNDEETEKRISAAVLQGASALLFDNLQRTVASSQLESMLTEGVATIRLFGKLESPTVECRALVLMTANNATLRRDMLRRTLPVRIVVPDEEPELRRFDFDPVDEARLDRTKLLAAAFTIAKAWRSARDLPDNAHIRAKTLGSFEAWADLVAGAVEWLTGVSPIDAIEARKGEDPADVAERAIITNLFDTFDDKFTAAQAATSLPSTTWREVLRFKEECPDGRAVGNWLQQRRDRAFSITPDQGKKPIIVTLQVIDRDRKGFAQWALKECRTAEPAEPDSMQPREKCQNKKVRGSDSFGVGLGTGSARFGGSAASDDARDRRRRADIEDPDEPTGPAARPAVGTIEDGYRYIGGDPGEPASWEPVQ